MEVTIKGHVEEVIAYMQAACSQKGGEASKVSSVCVGGSPVIGGVCLHAEGDLPRSYGYSRAEGCYGV